MSTGGRSGKAKRIGRSTGVAKPTGIPVNPPRGERVVGSGTGTKPASSKLPAPPKGSSKLGTLGKVAGALGVGIGFGLQVITVAICF